MIEVIEKEGKTEEEVLSTVNLEEVHYKIEEIPGKLFKGKKLRRSFKIFRKSN